MTDTPRTDKLVLELRTEEALCRYFAMVEHAEKLEREIDDLETANFKLERALLKAKHIR